jgi:hypothetical protein
MERESLAATAEKTTGGRGEKKEKEVEGGW